MEDIHLTDTEHNKQVPFMLKVFRHIKTKALNIGLEMDTKTKTSKDDDPNQITQSSTHAGGLVVVYVCTAANWIQSLLFTDDASKQREKERAGWLLNHKDLLSAHTQTR